MIGWLNEISLDCFRNLSKLLNNRCGWSGYNNQIKCFEYRPYLTARRVQSGGLIGSYSSLLFIWWNYMWKRTIN